MEEDEDDFYGSEGGPGESGEHQQFQPDDDAEYGMNIDQDEDEDSDDDVEFTLEKPGGANQEPSLPPTQRGTGNTSTNDPAQTTTTTSTNQPSRPNTAAATAAARPGSTPALVTKDPLTYNGKQGKDFPEIRTDKVDVHAIPMWPGTGKPITEVDIDADLAESSKPWRQPGTDQTDFFNYGFDEYSWAQYCVRQQMMTNTIEEGKQADAQMKAFLGGAGGGAAGAGGAGGNGNAGGAVGAAGGVGGMMPAMPPMPGMPEMDAGMMQMMSQAMQSGMPPEQFMQMMSGAGAPFGGSGGGVGFGNGGGGGFGGGGSGQNSVSPHPQSGNQGFQPPTGPSAAQHQHHQQSGGMPDNMDGYSAQQIAIMQQQQGGGMGGQGGRRGGRGRGRGYY